jgi:alkylation response protein AidB-like acyl-CoA dehydrogenase
MIDFSYTETQLAVRDMARELAQKVVLPNIQEFDREQKMNPEVLPAMASANLLGFCIPEKYGGLGTDYISLGLASEELEYADTAARVILSVHIGLFSLPVLTWANEAQKPDPDGERREDCHFRPDRTSGRHRRGGNSVNGGPGRRRLHSQRREDVDFSG